MSPLVSAVRQAINELPKWTAGTVESKDYPKRDYYSVDGVMEVLDKFESRGVQQYRLVPVEMNDTKELEKLLSEGWCLHGPPLNSVAHGVVIQPMIRPGR